MTRAHLLCRTTQSGNRFHSSQHDGANDESQHQVGARGQQRGNDPVLPMGQIFNSVVQWRNTVDYNTAAHQNIARVPTMDNTFIRRGAIANNALPVHCASELVFSTSQ